MKFWSIMLATMLTVFNLSPAWADTCSVGLPAQQLTPLPDLTGTYKGFSGLLYDGSNSPPPDHDGDGRSLANGVVPRDTSGNQNPSGKIVFLSLGFSNNTIEFCGGHPYFQNDPDDPQASPCPAPQPLQPITCTVGVNCPYLQIESFLAKAFAEQYHAGQIVIVDGAKGGITLDKWDPYSNPACNNTFPCYTEYDRVAGILSQAGVTEAQVQSIWFKSADADPTVSLPAANADAYTAETHLGNIVRAIRFRYQQAHQVFFSPRTYGGYANVAQNPLNPEPFAYELGFSIKWLINSQIQEMRGNSGDAHAGDLRYRLPNGQRGPGTWIDWGPYLWSDGHACKTGYACVNSDFRGTSDTRSNECTHPSTFGEDKVSTQLLNFVHSSPYTGWYLAY
jgi:hypothetical protein